MVDTDVDAIVISPAWPSHQSGYGIAVRSALQQYAQFFSKINFICLNEHPFTEQDEWNNGVCAWTHIPIVRQPKWERFLKSLFKAFPAVTVQYASKMIERQVLEIIRSQQNMGRKVVVIFEDVPPAWLLPNIRRDFPAIPVAIRSHNVLSKAFAGFKYRGHSISRLAWTLEVLKIRNYEKKICQMADRVWAISKNDSTEYLTSLGIRCHGVFGISVDINRYASVGGSDILSLLHVGSADLRKGHGLFNFIDSSWGEIKSEIREAKFVLGGKNTRHLTDVAKGIDGFGFIYDDRHILNKGIIFVNPQEIGSGIKIKSIIAMLAGKALVTTETGIEGVEGIDGVHFFVAKDTKGLSQIIIKLMKNPDLAFETGKRARELVLTVYSHESFAKLTNPILQNFKSLAEQL